jgi:hypothetical protein
MNRADVAIATMTMVRSSEEEAQLRRSLRVLAESGLPVAVADGGGSEAFSRFLAQLPGVTVTVPIRRGLVAQVQESIDCAATFGMERILYTEPDKEEFFATHLQRFVARAADAAEFGVVLAARSRSSFETFPPMQRYVESVVNHLCGERLGVEGDYCYGPFILRTRLVPHVACAAPNLGWGWRPFVFLAAHRQGFGITHVVGDYPCPVDQRTEDEAERMHRLRQLRENIAGLID